MAFLAGKNFYIKWNATDTSGYDTDCGLDLQMNLEDTTTFGAATAGEAVQPTIYKGSLKVSGIFDPTIDAVWGPDFLAGTGNTLTVAPNGSTFTASNPRYYGTAYIAKYGAKAAPKGMIKIDAEFQFSGTITRATS